MTPRNQGQARLCLVAGVLIFFAALLRYWMPYDPALSFHRNPEMFSLAYNLAQNGQFANPFARLLTGPSAHLAPAVPGFLALLVKVFGAGGSGMRAVEIASAISVSLLLALFPLMSALLGMGPLNGVLAAFFWIIAKVEINLGSEGFYAALLVAAACCCYRLLLDAEPPSVARLSLLLGRLIGVSLLVIPSIAPVFAVCIVWEMWRKRLDFFKGPALALVLLPALIVTPWLIRNYMVFHRIFFVRDDLGLELQVSNNDCAQFGQSANNNSGCFYKFHPNVNPAEAQKVLELGETRYNDLKLIEAKDWIKAHPAQFARLTAMRFIVFWVPNDSGKIFFWMPPPVVKTDFADPGLVQAMGPALPGNDTRRVREWLVIYLMTLLSVAGLVMLYKRDMKSTAILVSCLIFFPLIYYFVQFDGRYRYPILWITFLLGSLPISTLLAYSLAPFRVRSSTKLAARI